MNAKIKLIYGNASNELERLVNEFIVGKTVIDIRYQSFLLPHEFSSNGAPTRASCHDRVLIFYRED